MRKLLALLLIFFIMGGSNYKIVQASQTFGTKVYSEKPTEGTRSPYSNVAYGHTVTTRTTTTTNNVLSEVSTDPFSLSASELWCNSPGSLDGYAETIARYNVYEIGYRMTYQVWNGYSWVDYRYSSNSDFYTDRISSFDYQVVESNKYYRLVVTHFINDYGVTSYVVTTTDYLYVN